MLSSQVTALVFDVFDTVVDWRTSVIKQSRAFGEANGVTADWEAFADGWRGKYQTFMSKVRSGELPWTKLDTLHRMALEELLAEFNIAGVSEEAKADLNLAWHRLDPWLDATSGLTRLTAKFVIAAMSNDNIALITNMAKYAGLPWDCVLGAEPAQAYKPDPKTYLTGVELLGLVPKQVMMVASHHNDLFAAASQGLKTAFVCRPLEFGPSGAPDLDTDPSFDIEAQDCRDLASQLGV